MNGDREMLENWLGTALDPSYPVRVHMYEEHSDADYEVGYGAVELPSAAVAAVQEAGGLLTPDALAFADVMLPSAWSVEPGDPPDWWPTDPSTLTAQAGRPLEGGWLACGYGAGVLFVLETRAGSG